MTAAGAGLAATASARVFGAGCGQAFASWAPAASCWRDAELLAPDRPGAGGHRAPEFTGGWPPHGLTRGGSALASASSGYTAVGRPPRSWPTPKVTTNRGSRRAITRDGHWSAPGLGEAAELSEGILPREVGSLEEIKSPAARALWPGRAPRRRWGTPRASSGMTSRLRDPARIRAADGRLEDQVAIAEGRPGGWLNPEWVEWLMGFPAGWTPSTPAAEPDGALDGAHPEVVPVATLGATGVAALLSPPRAGLAHHGGDRRGPEKLRSPCHLEVRS